jgi:hypothetical protein
MTTDRKDRYQLALCCLKHTVKTLSHTGEFDIRIVGPGISAPIMSVEDLTELLTEAVGRPPI